MGRTSEAFSSVDLRKKTLMLPVRRRTCTYTFPKKESRRCIYCASAFVQINCDLITFLAEEHLKRKMEE